jgi:hypothetical protein
MNGFDSVAPGDSEADIYSWGVPALTPVRRVA